MSKELDDLNAKFAQEIELDKRQKDLRAKELTLKEHKVNNELDRLNEVKQEMKLASETNFGTMNEDQIRLLQKESTEYIDAAKKCMVFINDSFLGVVPFFRKNLIFIGGKTGEGKSTTVANIIRETIRQKNTETGKRRKALVLTNEEKSEDVYNRVTCLAKGWHYTNHDKFSEEQKNIFADTIPMLARDGMLTVVDNNYNGTFGTTTTLEGIEAIFENLIVNQIYYDVIVIDYYQNIKSSKKNPHMNEYEVQAKLANMLDRYKNIYPAPIVVMGQVKAPDKDKETPFEYRIKGRKVILDPSTLAMEMVADRENLRTEWVVHKSRFTEAVGQSFYTGYDRGRFVPYDTEFLTKVNKIKEDRQMAMLNKQIGIKNVFKKETTDGSND